MVGSPSIQADAWPKRVPLKRKPPLPDGSGGFSLVARGRLDQFSGYEVQLVVQSTPSGANAPAQFSLPAA